MSKIVPWLNTAEWISVYENLYSKSNQKDALNSLLIWKARCPSLPSGIESTLTLLEVYIQDGLYNINEDDQLLRLAYSSAIMRFVNHMLDADTAKGHSLYQAAQNRGVPDWIIDLRHDTAHSNNLPSLELLREATTICLQWLHDNYWVLHKDVLKACIIDKTASVPTGQNENIAGLINFCTTLSFCCHSFTKLSEVPQQMQQSLLNDARDMFGDKLKLIKPSKINFIILKQLFNSYSKKILKNVDKKQIINLIFGKESLFLSTKVYTAMSQKRITKHLNKEYVKSFEVFLDFLILHDILEDFILELIKITEGQGDRETLKLTAQWVSEILCALCKTQTFLEKSAEKKINIKDRKNKELRSLFCHWFPNEKSNNLLLNLSSPVPSGLQDINLLRPIISTYNPYLSYFINPILSLVKPKLPKQIVDNICQLVELISAPEKFTAHSNKIYTMEDVIQNNTMDSDKGFEAESSDQEIGEECEQFGIWKRTTFDPLWSSCPIGMLPWQKHQSDSMELD
ncbi:unnamed protein product [Leptosia nina]|uniref:Las1-like protein n=1 Tax=Leptosia nina TaxID=320188 RepID=A0AAV1J163_9NEOP